MTVKKRALSLLFALAFLITVFPLGTMQAKAVENNMPTIIVDTVEAVPGSEVTVNVSIKNNPGILGATLTLSFGDGVTLTKATSGDNNAFSAMVLTKPGKLVSPCNFVWDGQELTAEDIKDGSLLALTFQVSEEAKSGKTIPIEISYDLFDQNLSAVQANVTNGGITVKGDTLGDVNGDGIFSLSVVILLARYLVNLETLSKEQLDVADVNHDGKATNADVVKLARILADLESFE